MSFLRFLLFVITSLTILVSSSYAQRCGVHTNSNNSNPQELRKRQEAVRKINKQIASLRLSAADSVKIYKIPVVVHVIWNTAEQNVSDEIINSQIRILNEDFRRKNADTVKTFEAFKPVAGDAGFEFFLAAIDPAGNPTTGIIRKYTANTSFYPNGTLIRDLASISSWPNNQYLNIWVINTNSTTDVIGIGPDPDQVYFNKLEPEDDGIILKYNVVGKNNYTYNLGRTGTHEVGHWLSMYHIFGSDENTPCGDDMISDTPLQQKHNYELSNTCPATNSICDGIDRQTMSNNYMDYSPDVCMNIFTKGQIARMRQVMETNTFRKALQNSPAQRVVASVNIIQDNTAISIQPNPSKDFITLKSEFGNLQNVDLFIFNTVGQEVMAIKEYSLEGNAPVDVTNIPAGIYFVKSIVNNQVAAVGRFIKL